MKQDKIIQNLLKDLSDYEVSSKKVKGCRQELKKIKNEWMDALTDQ